MYVTGSPLKNASWFYCVRFIQCLLGFLLLLMSTPAYAMYSFPAVPSAPLPPGCMGSAGVYTCNGYINIQDHIQFLESGNVSITVNGTLNIGAYTLGNATQNANVTFLSNGLVMINSATIHANIQSGIYAMTVLGTSTIRGNLQTSNGAITFAGSLQGEMAASGYGTISLSQNAVINGNVSARSGAVTLARNVAVHGNLSTTSGSISLNGFNNIAAWVNCDHCNLYIYGQGNTLAGDVNVGSVYAFTAEDTHIDGAVNAWSGYLVLGSGSVVHGAVSVTATGLASASYMAIYQSVLHAAVNVRSDTDASLYLYHGSTIHGSVQVTNHSALLAPLNNNVFVDSQSVINSSVTVTGVIDNYGSIMGCAKTTSSYMWAIKMQLNSTTAGVCCANGNVCSQSACVFNLWGYPVHKCSTPAAKFNCIDPTVNNANAANGRLFTQVANHTFSLDVVALAADHSVNTDYVVVGGANKSVNLKFFDCGDPNVLANQSCAGQKTEISSQTVIFSSSHAGRRAASVSIPNAYRNVRCQVSDANATQQDSLSSDNFAVRPASFNSISTSNANADVPHGSSSNQGPVIKAGSGRFAISANTGLSHYNGIAKIDHGKVIPHVGASHTGVLSGAFDHGGNGSSTGTEFSYDEVGYFRFNALGVYDDTFSQVDIAAGDCAPGFVADNHRQACSFGYVPAVNEYLGRFVPDHFTLSPLTVTPACSNQFTYFGQDGLITHFRMQAQNASEGITQNYTGAYGGFARLNLSSDPAYHFSLAPATFSLLARAAGPSGQWQQGVATVQATHQVKRPDHPTPVTAVSVLAKPVDDDGVTTATVLAVSAGSPFRYGRLYLAPVHGSELLALPVQLEAQYWNGGSSSYVRSVGDSCTTVPLSSLVMKEYKGHLNSCETHWTGSSTMANGLLGLKLTAPGVSTTGQPNTGSVDVEVNLGHAANHDKTCLSQTETAASSGNLPWFGSVDPAARMTFGVYKSPIVYMRERF